MQIECGQKLSHLKPTKRLGLLSRLAQLTRRIHESIYEMMFIHFVKIVVKLSSKWNQNSVWDLLKRNPKGSQVVAFPLGNFYQQIPRISEDHPTLHVSHYFDSLFAGDFNQKSPFQKCPVVLMKFTRKKNAEIQVPSGSIRFHQVPSGSIRFHQVPSGSIRFHQVPSGSIRFHHKSTRNQGETRCAGEKSWFLLFFESRHAQV